MAITLTEMTQLARALVAADEAVERAKTALAETKEKARRLREETIPSAMQELGVESITLDTGEKLSVKQDVYASITKANQHAAYGWLVDNGFGGLIKTDVISHFGRDDVAKARALFDSLAKKGVSVETKESVHPQTLAAFLREQLAAANDVPLDLFGARPVWVAKLSSK